MAAYPSFPQLIGSVEEWVDDVVLDRAVGGGVKSRSFFSAKKRRFLLKHTLDSTDRGTLQTFYDTNRALAITLVWAGNGQTYTCLFESAPKIEYLNGILANIEVRLAEQ
jgi:hypothetical protein